MFYPLLKFEVGFSQTELFFHILAHCDKPRMKTTQQPYIRELILLQPVPLTKLEYVLKKNEENNSDKSTNQQQTRNFAVFFM